MKHRRHHNNKGYRQVRNGATRAQVRAMAKKLEVPYGGINHLKDVSSLLEAL